MGMDLSTVIGPYIEIEGKREKTTIKVKRVCPKHPNKEQDGKYCSACGTLIENVEYSKIEKIHPYHLFEDDGLYSPEGMDGILLPNNNPPGEIDIDNDGSTTNLIDTDLNLLKENQIKWMKEKYEKEIEILVRTFGEDMVKVSWGINSYWS